MQPTHHEISDETERPRCGAKCRDGHSCRTRAMRGRTRCRMHGGTSTGPKTEAGKAAIAESNRKRQVVPL